MAQISGKSALIDAAVRVGVLSLALLDAGNKVALVNVAVSKDEFAAASYHISRKFARIDVAVRIFHLAVSLADKKIYLARVDGTVRIGERLGRFSELCRKSARIVDGARIRLAARRFAEKFYYAAVKSRLFYQAYSAYVERADDDNRAGERDKKYFKKCRKCRRAVNGLAPCRFVHILSVVHTDLR